MHRLLLELDIEGRLERHRRQFDFLASPGGARDGRLAILNPPSCRERISTSTRPALLQPCDIVDGGVGSGFDAAMIAVYGLMPTDRRILESPCFLLDCEDLDILQQRSLIALERYDVVRFLVHDLLGDALLWGKFLEATGLDGIFLRLI